MSAPTPLLAASETQDFFVKLLTGVSEGNLVSLLAVGIVGLVVLRFVAARWVFTLVKQLVIFGGLAAAVWFGSKAIGDRYGQTSELIVLYGGGAVVLALLSIMLYMFFLRSKRERAGAGPRPKGSPAPTPRPGAKPTAQAQTAAAPNMAPHAMRVTPAPVPAGGAGQGGNEPLTQQAPVPAEEQGRLEETLRKLNVLGTSKDQNLMTVMVLILVAQFGVFTSKTIAAPNAQVGMVLFAVFALGAFVFVKTSYKNYLTGVRHFVFATLFALALSLVMLVYWQGSYCDPTAAVAAATATADCAGAMKPVTWSVALNPTFYFASDGLIATISAVAFSTLLTKGG